MAKQYLNLSQKEAVDHLEANIWSDGRDMHGYPAEVTNRYLGGETTLDVCVGYASGYAVQFVQVDMLYYIERVAAFVQKAYGYERAERAEQ